MRYLWRPCAGPPRSPIEFEPMDANMDGYFSSDQQRIAIREGMSEVQTVSAAVHETAHSKLHDPKTGGNPNPPGRWSWSATAGPSGTIPRALPPKQRLNSSLPMQDWRFVDENQFEWRLEVEEDHSSEVQAAKTGILRNVQAESISYAVCQYYGIQTGENSFGYIASWSQGKELKELRASLEVINKTAGELISDIDRHYKEICKERGIESDRPAGTGGAPTEVAPEPEVPMQSPARHVYKLPQQF